jgi:L-glyceraldehyde 3-phosphate reductase
VDERRLAQARALNRIAASRGQSLAQMALAWVLRDAAVTSALAGASGVDQLTADVAALARLDFSAGELAEIEAVLT